MSEQPAIIEKTGNGGVKFTLPAFILRCIGLVLLGIITGAGGTAAWKGVQPIPQIQIPKEMADALKSLTENVSAVTQDLALSKADRANLHEMDNRLAAADQAMATMVDSRMANMEKKIDDLFQLMVKMAANRGINP